MNDKQSPLTAYVAAFVHELAESGVKHVVISPGSRSTPMAMMMAEHRQLTIHLHVDERSAAFFALGIAKASATAVALLCTSGTAAANYYPAIIEAKQSRVPLIVLTADRPHELRDNGAPQTIDQIHLYGNNVKWFAEMALPEKSETMIRYVRTAAVRATETAIAKPAGPVHLNFPFREPLIPQLEQPDLFASPRAGRFVNVQGGEMKLTTEQYEQIAEMMNESKRGLIVCGPLESEAFIPSLLQLAEAGKMPILADPLSQIRSSGKPSEMIISTYDTILKNEDAQKLLAPDFILRFGAMPVSKPLMLFMKANGDLPQFVVDGGGGWRDANLQATEMIHCDEEHFCQSVERLLTEKAPSTYSQTWKQLEQQTISQLKSIQAVEHLSEAKLFSLLHEYIEENATLFVGNSMPIRDLDTFFHMTERKVKMMGNRGANGIDGIVSTALGAAVITQPLYLVVGDLTFFHDLNGLIAAKMYGIPITVIVINNNGGGIFSFLPQAQEPTHFEQLFGTPLHLDFSYAVEMYGGKYIKITDWDEFTSVMNEHNDGLRVIEIETNRQENVQEHRQLSATISREISRFLKGDGDATRH